MIKSPRNFAHRLVLPAVTATVVCLWAEAPLAVGAWTGGEDIYHVPLSWCAIKGSRAWENPNILPLGATTPDTTTDVVLWRRHERPTDNIYIDPTGISFRSAINNSWGTLSFPPIDDPDTSTGVEGDILDDPSFVEYNAIIDACDEEWDMMGKGGIGITTVNINLIHDANGNYVDAEGAYLTPIGLGGCYEDFEGVCDPMYGGYLAVVDNHYLYPTVPDRTFPPGATTDPGGTSQYVLTDSLDQLVGHELGHALSLEHRADVFALMNEMQEDNNGDGDVDNIALNNAEVTQLRDYAPGVPEVEIDPPTRFIPGDVVRTRIPDRGPDVEKLPRYADISAVSAILNKRQERVTFGANMAGVIPSTKSTRLQVWFLIDTDNEPTGIALAELENIGAPTTNFSRAELVIRVEVANDRATGKAWRLVGDRLSDLTQSVRFDLRRLFVRAYYAKGSKPTRKIERAPARDLVIATLPVTLAELRLDKPFNIQAISVNSDVQALDRLDDSEEERGIRFVVENPSFPHCFVQDTAAPGGTVKIRVDGLVPDRGIHGLLGPTPTFAGRADAAGNAEIDFPIPSNARPGLHLVTIGTDGTALTADCAVTVVESEIKPPSIGMRQFLMIRSHEELLKGQQRLLEKFGLVLHELLSTRDVSDDAAVRLTGSYLELVRQQSALVASFEKLMRQTIENQ